MLTLYIAPERAWPPKWPRENSPASQPTTFSAVERHCRRKGIKFGQGREADEAGYQRTRVEGLIVNVMGIV